MYPQLTNYIKQARMQNLSDPQIKQNLLAAGWSEKDIEGAMNEGAVSVSQAPASTPAKEIKPVANLVNPSTVYNLNPAFQQKQEVKNSSGGSTLKILLVVFFIILLAGGGYYAYVNYFKEVLNMTSRLDANTIVNTQNNEQNTQIPVVVPNTPITTTVVTPVEEKKIVSDPNGLPDLIVSNLILSSENPIVNDKDFKITISVKNIGTKTSDVGVSLVANLLGFSKSSSTQSEIGGGIAPGDTDTLDFYPYKNNDTLKLTDTPGQKTIQIVLNKDKKVKEVKYDNNTFTQTVQVYDK